ncbi:lytic transglycosylase domain-containing protein [Mangrovicoccus algicola]|uniref:Lytic transglycosylase domain-containing protein n=1 Tax=Mangrovicoccus algicola TaxID=2771008 RepID=A0A8J7CIW5_9RHOB|nr:lytic transglycosylase domain-containing protein [Mangrovicoccus algicola]MBE3640095.1 lytic transglycosylase domain-containing protein [Mangrovicoccus algicola]
MARRRARTWTRARALALAGSLVGFLSPAAPGWAAFSDALGAAGQGRWDAARAEARGEGTYAPLVIEWMRLRSADGGATFAEYRAFLRDHADWPGIPYLRRRGEAAIDATVPQDQVLEFFASDDPQTANGSYWLALALAGAGREQGARDTLVRAWTQLGFSREEEALFLGRFRDLLAPHHAARMDSLLWRGAWDQAERMEPLVGPGWQALATARKGLRLDRPGVDGLIAAVPEALRDDPGLAFERMAWRMRRGRYMEAAELMQAQSRTAATLGRPDLWADYRGRLGRQLMRDGDYREAYLVAAGHRLTPGADYADLEWLAGYVALRFLEEPGAALDHFQRLRAGVSSPISLGRAGYWEGRAYEALGEAEQAKQAYAFGAGYQSSFYGQLAAERGGFSPDPRLAGKEVFADGVRAPFRSSSVYQAGVTIFEAGDLALAARFFSHLSESLSRADIGSMAARLELLKSPHVELEIGKRAAWMGYELHRPLFPVMALDTRATPDVEPELALSIARRESEFNHTVISHAGARGLMQLMPGTAQAMAAATGLAYDSARLTRDAGYNARLGAAYLQRLREEFGGNTVLVAAGYNAGPGRPRAWMVRYGDPRDPAVDAVDWIEHIPFTETRNYVMRVMESMAPYRARLSGTAGPLGLTAALSAR